MIEYPFRPRRSKRNFRTRRRSRKPLLFLVLAAVGVFWLVFEQFPPQIEANTTVVEVVPPPVPEIRREWHEGEIQPGETVTGLLGEHLSEQEIYHLNRDSRDIFPLSSLCAGQPYKICLTEGTFSRFEYDINATEQFIVDRTADGFAIARQDIPYDVRVSSVQGEIRSSLFEAMAEIGESAELTMALADIFAWDIDFVRDIRSGDSFRVLVERRYRDGEFSGYGRILAAEFTNNGNAYDAFYFKDGDLHASYYDSKGQSLRKAFLKAPLSFSHISSGFSNKRFHPITKTWKSHPAIDYAAATGTPIKAVGDGKIIKIGYTKYNGNYVKLRHNDTYETLYLHMNKFARGMRQGTRVAQGQVIGYVGSTGLATGPHLCFRMYKRGTPVNPYSVRPPSVAPVSDANLAEFKAQISPLIAHLQRLSDPSRVASAVAESGQSLN